MGFLKKKKKKDICVKQHVQNNNIQLKYNLLTSVDDCFPLVKLALVRDGVKVPTLDVSEGRQAMRTRCGVAGLVPLPLSQTIPPSVLRSGR